MTLQRHTVADRNSQNVTWFTGMVAGHFRICRKAADRLEVELAGELTERVMVACDAEARTHLSVTKAGGVKVLFDLTCLTGYSLEARDALVALQRFLGGKASQTAFIASTASGRSLALWVAHMTDGQVIKSFSRLEDATTWLSGCLGPTTGVRPVPQTREEKPTRKRRRTAS
jgi:hypothetical protein